MWSTRVKKTTALLLGSVWWFGQLLAAHMISSPLFFSSLGGCMNFCSGWKAETTFPPVSWVFTEPHFLGWPAGGSHTHCCVLYTQCNTATNTTVGKKNLRSHFTIPICQVWRDVTKRQIVDGHFTLVLHCASENLCVFVLSVCCWCYLCQWCTAEDHMKWLTALAWPTFFFFLP